MRSSYRVINVLLSMGKKMVMSRSNLALLMHVTVPAEPCPEGLSLERLAGLRATQRDQISRIILLFVVLFLELRSGLLPT